jgi:hypothetical protein
VSSVARLIITTRGDSLSKAPAASSLGDRGIEPAPRSTRSQILQAFTAGLQHREAAPYAAGLKDGEEGAAFRPSAAWSPEYLISVLRSGDQPAISQILSYALGYHSGGKYALRTR